MKEEKGGVGFSASVRIDTLRRAGLRRLMWRARRLISFGLIYPRFAPWLFNPPVLDAPERHDRIRALVARETLSARVVFREGMLEKAEALCQRGFDFLNLPRVNIRRPAIWACCVDEDPLWCYMLHYGEWAVDLARAFQATCQERFKKEMIRLMQDWVESNPPGSRPGWEPYPVSRRLVAWSRVALAMEQDEAWGDFWKTSLAPSMCQQARLLEASLEKDLDNNHLMSNYRALAWIGLMFPDWPRASRWRTVGLEGLWYEMRRQVLSDGCHEERSISYHTLVLQDLMETYALCQIVGLTVPEDVVPTLDLMLKFLADIQAPDGTYPMFNDTVPGYPVDPRSVLLAAGLLFHRPQWLRLGHGGDPSYAAWLAGEVPPPIPASTEEERPPSVSPYPKAGYVVLRGENGERIYFDSGPMGPFFLPGHGHADALSLSLFAHGRWLIVDPGVYTYHRRPWRDLFRSTMAHNTITVDGLDQCVFWGAFRVAYPPRVRLLGWSEDHAMGEHDGYARLEGPVLHNRIVERKGKGVWAITDRLRGRGEHDFALTLQLAPGAEAEAEGARIKASWPGGPKMLGTCSPLPVGAKAVVEPGLFSQGWNMREEPPRWVLRWHTKLPAEIRVVLELG